MWCKFQPYILIKVDENGRMLLKSIGFKRISFPGFQCVFDLFWGKSTDEIIKTNITPTTVHSECKNNDISSSPIRCEPKPNNRFNGCFGNSLENWINRLTAFVFVYCVYLCMRLSLFWLWTWSDIATGLSVLNADKNYACNLWQQIIKQQRG